MAEERIGFAFNNPDTTNDYHFPGWGLLVSHDELRYDEMFGNSLIAGSDSQDMTDDQLLDYSRTAIAWLERELNFDIIPRIIRYSDRIDEVGKKIERKIPEDKKLLSRMNQKQKQYYVREPGYAYGTIKIKNEAMIKLRRRPVLEIMTADFVDPFYGRKIINLLPYHFLRNGTSGMVFFRPRILSGAGIGWEYVWNNYLINPRYSSLQELFLIDYKTGYNNCADVPDDLRMIIKKVAAVTLMSIFGDGKMSAIASRSVSLNAVSESINTTMSATSAMFGARIRQYQGDIKLWLTDNKQKFSRTSIGSLGRR